MIQKLKIFDGIYLLSIFYHNVSGEYKFHTLYCFTIIIVFENNKFFEAC